MKPRHLRPVPTQRAPAPIFGADATPDPTITVHEPHNIGRWPALVGMGGTFYARLLEWRTWTNHAGRDATYTAHASYTAAQAAAQAAALEDDAREVHVVALVQQHVWVEHDNNDIRRARVSRRLAEWPPHVIQAEHRKDLEDLADVIAEAARQNGETTAPALRGLRSLIHRARAAHTAYQAARRRNPAPE